MDENTVRRTDGVRVYYEVAVGLIVLAILYAISRNNYLLFHGIAEVFSSVVAFMIFVLAWHTRRLMDNDYLLFLGIAYLFIGSLDLIHMLAYSGMGIFEGYGANLATQLWIATRYIEALTLLAAPLFLFRKLWIRLDMAVYAAVVALVLLSIFLWDIFPTCFVEGAGLTPFKKISEYVISFILLLAIGILFRYRGRFDVRVFSLMVASITVTIVSELSFTLYADPYGFFNLLGHGLKIISFYLIYRAIVETGLERPYTILFRDLKRREEELSEREERERAILNATADSLLLLEPDGTVLVCNDTAARRYGKTVEEMMNTNILELIPREEIAERRSGIDEELRQGRAVQYEDEQQGSWFDNTIYPVFDDKGEVEMLAVYSKDITKRKRMEEALRESEEKFRSTVEQSTDGIVLVDPRGNIIEWNSAQEDIVGLAGEEAIGRPLWEVQHLLALPEQRTPAAYEDLKSSVLGSLDRGYESWFGETSERELLSPQGERRIIQVVSFPIQSGEGMMVGNITRDITRRVQTEKDLAYEVEVNKAIAELSSALLAQESIDDVSYVVLENARRLTGSKYGYVGYIDSDTGNIVSPTLSRDIWEQCGVEGKDIVFSEFTGLWGWVLNNRESLLTNQPQDDPRSTGVPKGHIPIERFISVPALLGGALVGQIALANSNREYVQKDLEFLDRMADLYAMAVLRMWSEGELAEYREHLEELVKKRTLELEEANRQLQEEIAERRRNQEELRATAEQLRALSARVESVREEERRHVAREVHDTLGQSLTGLKISLSLLGKKLSGDTESEARIAYMSDLVDTTIRSVREISTELRPGVLDDLGLAAALDWQMKRFEEMTGLECSFVSEVEDDLMDKDLAITLFRIAQEALTNIARHAGADRVDVSLVRGREGILLEVKDNGRGISEEEIAGRGSLGILGMRERANIYGGEVEIRGARGAGTTLSVRIPVETDGGAENKESEEAGD